VGCVEGTVGLVGCRVVAWMLAGGVKWSGGGLVGVPNHRGVEGAFVGEGPHGEVDGSIWLM